MVEKEHLSRPERKYYCERYFFKLACDPTTRNDCSEKLKKIDDKALENNIIDKIPDELWSKLQFLAWYFTAT